MSKNTEFTLFPIVRQGYRPDEPFTKAGNITDSGSTDVTLSIEGTGPDGTTTEDVETTIDIYGPGEVTALDTDQIVRMEPEPATTEFPPNYFPLVEFDSPYLPWQFSPERADDQGRNRPWLCLVVVPREPTELEPPGTGALPVLQTSVDQLPDPAETWAWAHAQLVGDGNPEGEFASRSTRTVSRLLCPRNLSPKTKYRACIVPTFEPGRRAGLGMEPDDGGSTVEFAWGNNDTVRLPVYHHWEFTSAPEGDFESLARELDQETFKGDVGFRTIDVSNPGPQQLKPKAVTDTDVGTVAVGGALKAIGADPDGYDDDLAATLRELLNKPETVERETDYGAVGPPLYGKWHAGVPELEPPSADTEQYYYPTWFNSLNTDPRHRIAAGYGTQAIRQNQEGLMQNAWAQFGEIQEANRYLDRVKLAEVVQKRRYEQLESLSTGSLLGLTEPLHGTMLDESIGATIEKQTVDSDLPSALASPAFRRIIRPGGPMARRTDVSIDTTKLVTRLETGRIPRNTDGLGVTFEAASNDSPPVNEAPGAQGSVPDQLGDAPGGQSEIPSELGDLPVDSFEAEGLAFPVESDQVPGGETEFQALQGTPEDGKPPVGGPTGTGQGSDDRHPSIERVLVVLDSVEEHAQTAKQHLSELKAAITAKDQAAITTVIEESPTIRERCESIGPDTFGPLTWALSKLLTERPESLPETFDRASTNSHLRSLQQTQRDLDSAIAETVGRIRAEQPQPRARDRALDRAKNAIERMLSTIDAMRSGLQPATSTMQALSADADVSVEPAAIETDVSMVTDIGEPSPANVEMPSLERMRGTVLEALDPSKQLHELAADVLGIPDLHKREDPVENVMAAPTFTDFGYELLSELDQEYFLPGAGEIPKNSMGILQTNPEFIEAFMTGLNHEMARELQWRRYPTDRRGTYFRRFWDRRVDPDTDTEDPEEMADIDPIHNWDQNDLGDNSPGDDQAQVVLLIRGELLRRYPNTDIFAAKAVKDGDDRTPALPETHVTRKDGEEKPDLKYPVFKGRLDPDITFFGFDLTPDEALYDPYHSNDRGEPDDHADEGWFFVLQEPPAETRFGLDVGDETDTGQTPPGITIDGNSQPKYATETQLEEGVEHGWNALSWAHLVGEDESPGDVTYVSIEDSRPGREGWSVEDDSWYVEQEDGANSGDSGEDAESYGRDRAGTWGYNSAHMARATWQLPVRISIHADDMITEDSADAWRMRKLPQYNMRYLGEVTSDE